MTAQESGPGSGDTPPSPHERAPRRPGTVPAVLGFALGWAVGYAVARIVANRLLSGSASEGFSGLALALSIAGFLRIGVFLCALAGCYLVLRIYRAPNAVLTVLFTVAAWWLVTAAMGLAVPHTLGAVWFATVAAVILSPLVASVAAVRLAAGTSLGAAAAVAIASIVVSSIASTAIGNVSSDRAIKRLANSDREHDQIDFTPFVPAWLPTDLPSDRDVFGPIGTSRNITLSYGDASNGDDPHHVMLMETRLPLDPCGATGPSGSVLACSQVGTLTAGTPIQEAEFSGNPGTVWTVRGSTVIVLLCHLEPSQGCVRNDGELNPEAVRILESLTEAAYTPSEPLSADPPSIVPAGG